MTKRAEHAIEFAEWILANPKVIATQDETWMIASPQGELTLTTEELYNIFKEEHYGT